MRIRTTGVDVRIRLSVVPALTGSQEAQFKFEGFDFQMIDVGGQRYDTSLVSVFTSRELYRAASADWDGRRSERRKWIDHFDRITAVLFCVSMGEYDQTYVSARHYPLSSFLHAFRRLTCRSAVCARTHLRTA